LPGEQRYINIIEILNKNKEETTKLCQLPIKNTAAAVRTKDNTISHLNYNKYMKHARKETRIGVFIRY